ncbi:MAG: hypothetical protein WA871_05315 [Candidatus Acidiferrales bacterium]
MPFQTHVPHPPALAGLVIHGARLPLVLPLIAVCLLLAALIPRAASRGKFHIPGYGGATILAFACALLLGRLSGARRIAGTPVGISLAIIFFLLIALALGCLLAVFCYRPPLQE